MYPEEENNLIMSAVMSQFTWHRPDATRCNMPSRKAVDQYTAVALASDLASRASFQALKPLPSKHWAT